MGYIKSKESIPAASITVCIMERHQAEQVEKLMEIVVKPDSLEDVHRSRGSPADKRGCFKCTVALATVMGLVIVALVTGFILKFYMFPPSCNQDAPPVRDRAKVSTAYNLTKIDNEGRYDIFTVNKSTTYLIYGWVKFSGNTSGAAILKQMLNGKWMTLQSRSMNETVSFFGYEALLAIGSRISIFFRSDHTDSLFHLYEL